jgi:hypothetical protein
MLKENTQDTSLQRRHLLVATQRKLPRELLWKLLEEVQISSWQFMRWIIPTRACRSKRVQKPMAKKGIYNYEQVPIETTMVLPINSREMPRLAREQRPCFGAKDKRGRHRPTQLLPVVLHVLKNEQSKRCLLR